MKNTIASSPFHPDWPDASWNISGLFAYDSTLNLFLDEIERHASSHPVKSIHGSPHVKWNGGRYNIAPTSIDLTLVQDTIQKYNGRGIAVGLTFTNSILQAEDFEDPTGNRLLEMISAGSLPNFVVVNNTDLGNYIREKYPRVIISSSITKVATENGRGKLDYYRTLEDQYPIVVLHPDDNISWGLVEQLDKKLLEVCVNEQCILSCPVRRNHYRLTDRYIYTQDQKDLEAVETLERKACVCGSAVLDEAQNPDLKRRTTLTKPEVKRHYDLGVRQFKLQSRRDPNFGSYNLLYDICHFVLEPDTYAELVFKKALRMSLQVKPTNPLMVTAP